MGDRKKGISLVLIATTFWGMMGINSRTLSLAGLSAMDIAFIRCSTAGVLFTIYMMIRKPEELKQKLSGILVGCLYGVVCFVLGFMTYNVSVEAGVLFTIYMMIRKPEELKQKLSGILVGCLYGVVCFVLGFMTYNVSVERVPISVGANLDVIGIAAGLINGMTFAMQIIIPRFFDGKYSKDAILVYGFISSTVVLSFFTDFSNIAAAVTGPNSMVVIANMLAISVLSTFIASTFYVKSTEYIETQVTSILVSLEPILGSIFAFFIFGETMSQTQLLGAAIVILAACILEADLSKITEKIMLPFSSK